MNSLWFDKDLKNATDTARIHHQLTPNQIFVEPAMFSNHRVSLSVCLSLCLSLSLPSLLFSSLSSVIC